ncbi:unnamed protein product [Ceutorhynchus assimilis]|uniref:Uncharacterized protein n=1 Tax=Ceutorhynchus assimilis TaxID=467358 RepID=A0A9N9MKX2_9CUCU|nr:unnamed protein product [Ceutorhynchus assimilis]
MWIFVVSACVGVVLVMSLFLCLCWRNKTPKNEWLGVDGMVTQKNPDENVNHLPSASPCMNRVANGEVSDKRNTISNSRRSLPDIPSEMVAGVVWEANGDNSSEHYATLGQYQNPGEKPATTNGLAPRSSISQHSSLSQADDTFSPYERVKYDKIKSKEHPYAQVQPNPMRTTVYEENHTSVEERVTLLRTDVPSTSTAVSTTPIRSRRSSAQSTEPTVDIPAATAVAGGIAASYELPYMTPPINFSGDSQDSSKGYTSISVREPLANILAQTNSVTKQKRKLDVHYSTVSDDSDDVYTTIPDPNNPIYTSESETYARIPPLPITVEAEINIPPSERSNNDRPEVDQVYEEPPVQPSNVDGLKHVTSHTHTHSRQASSSSSANFGSPKPEKRQANSPLPPPPPDPSHDFNADKLQVKRNLDDLYAKVQKNRKEDVTDTTDGSSDRSSLNESVRGSIVVHQTISKDNSEHNYETLKKSSTTQSDFGYEKIKGAPESEPGYASINGPDSLAASSDPGYEALQQVHMKMGPNYEELRPSNDINEAISNNSGYSVVNKKKKVSNTLLEEHKYEHPTYTTKSSGSESDPNYESVNNQSDPNYESVKDLELFDDPTRTDYETLRCSNVSESSNSRTTESEPPYERLRNDIDSDVPGYNKVDGSSGSSGNEIEPIQNEENDLALNIHDENAVVQV